jgi:hypothetical protein
VTNVASEHAHQPQQPPPIAARTELPLAYATPVPKGPDEEFAKAMAVVRRVVFALGAGLFMFGVGNGWMDYTKADVGAWMGWGAGLMALSWPGPLRSRRTKK